MRLQTSTKRKVLVNKRRKTDTWCNNEVDSQVANKKEVQKQYIAKRPTESKNW